MSTRREFLAQTAVAGVAAAGPASLLEAAVSKAKAPAQNQSETKEGQWYYPPVKTHLIRSKHVAQTFKIQVALPPRRRGDTAPLPVVYVTDANEVFDLFKEHSRLMQVFGLHPFPSFILVGIGYPSDLPYAGLLLRSRDNTLPDQPMPDRQATKALYASLEGLLLPEEGSKTWGGAGDFRDFMAEELVPFIDKTYATLPGHRTYFGHSGGGLLGLFTLCTRPELFRNYVVSSPGWFNHKDDDFGFRMVRRFISSSPTLQDTKLYMSVGTEEDYQPTYYLASQVGASLTADFFRMVALLKNAAIPGLTIMAEPIPNEVHISVWPIAFMHGVQAVFGMRRIGGIY